MVPWTPSGFGLHAIEAEFLQIELIDEDVDDADRVVFTDVVIQAFGEQRALRPILTFDKSLHRTALETLEVVYRFLTACCCHTEPE
jgi:hypothetical protein